MGLLNLSRSAALFFSPGGAGLNEPARARLFLKYELCQQSELQQIFTTAFLLLMCRLIIVVPNANFAAPPQNWNETD